MADTLTLQRLFIGGLYPDITSSQLEARFKIFGDIKSVSIQSKKGETPDQNKTFAYINLKTTDGNIKKCMSSYNNTKWKGNVMKIQIAKENFLDRLKQEREENNKVLKEPLEKTPESDFKIKDFTVKGAKPGTPTDQEHWVVGKYGRVLPVLELKRRDRKKTVEIDPSKLCHAIKQFKEEDIEQGGVSEMTWQLEDKDSPMTKKRKGEFPKIKKQKKRKNQVVVDAQKTPESNNLSSTPAEKLTTEVTATSSGQNSLTNLKNIKTKQPVETEIVPRLSEFEIVSLQEDLDKTAKKNVVEQVGKQKKGRNSERDSTGSADTDQVILKMKKKTRKRSDSTSSLTIPVGGPQPAKKKVKTQNEKNTIKSSEKQSQQTDLNILKWNTINEFESGIVDDVTHQRRTWHPRPYNSDSEDDFEKIIKGKIKIEDIENKMRKTVGEDDSTNDNESSKLKSENKVEYHSSSESEQENTESNNESNLEIRNKSRAHKKSTNEIVKPTDQENLTKSSDEDTSLSEESISEKENASSASGSDEANVNDNSGNLKTESAMEESEPPNEDEISVDSNGEDESSVDSNGSGNASDDEFEESDVESNDSASELVSESENDSGESEEESSESENENSQPIKTKTPQVKAKKVDENVTSNKVNQMEEEDSGSDFEMFETAAMTTSKKKMSTEKMKEFVRNRKECEKLESSSDDSDSEVEMKNEIKPEVETEVMRKESKIETKPKIESKLMKIESKSEANVKIVDSSKTKVPKTTTNQTAEEKHALANQKRLDALKQKHKEMKEQQSAMKIALTSLDKQTSKAQHTKFDSDDDDDDDVTVQATAVKEAGSGKTLDDPNVVKPKSKLSKEKKSLFDSDSESDSSDKEDAEMFKIRPEYEGEAGKKLIKLQSRFGNDSRFKLDERFIESDEDGDEGKPQDVAMETHDENIDGKSEKERALEILSSVVGHVKVDRYTKASLSSFSAPRFDPTKEEHQKFEIKKDVTAPKSKAARAKDKAAQEAAAEPEEETLPEVSTEKYFEVQDNLKESIEQGQNTPFSFLSAFSSGGDAGDKDDEGNVTEASDSLRKGSSSTAEVESRQSGTTASTMLPWQSNPFSYDSSSDEDEDDATSANKVVDEQETKTESKTTTMTTTFFYFENDERLQDCHSYFHPVEDKDALKENWLEKRPDRVEAYRTRHKRAVRQVRVTRSRENQRGRGRGRGRGTPSRRSF